MIEEDPVTILTEGECWEMLSREEFGRLAFHLAGEVHITPINYVVDGRRLLFRTAEGGKLLGVAMNDDVAFEIDDFGDTLASSVVLRGRASILEGPDADIVDNLPLRPWVPTTKLMVVEIRVDEISGRKFTLQRPWLHARPS